MYSSAHTTRNQDSRAKKQAKNNPPNAAKAVPPAQPSRNVKSQAKKPPARAATVRPSQVFVCVCPCLPSSTPSIHVPPSQGRPWKSKRKRNNKTRTVLVSACPHRSTEKNVPLRCWRAVRRKGYPGRILRPSTAQQRLSAFQVLFRHHGSFDWSTGPRGFDSRSFPDPIDRFGEDENVNVPNRGGRSGASGSLRSPTDRVVIVVAVPNHSVIRLLSIHIACVVYCSPFPLPLRRAIYRNLAADAADRS